MSTLTAREIFSRNVRIYRTGKNLSQENLAEISGLHRTYIGSVERSERNITIDVMEKISKALEVSIIDLLKE